MLPILTCESSTTASADAAPVPRYTASKRDFRANAARRASPATPALIALSTRGDDVVSRVLAARVTADREPVDLPGPAPSYHLPPTVMASYPVKPARSGALAKAAHQPSPSRPAIGRISPQILLTPSHVDTIELWLARVNMPRIAFCLLFVLGCGSQAPNPKPLPCGVLGDNCSKTAPCCRSINRAPIECLAGICEYR